MKHYIVYHNPERRGVAAEECDLFSIVTSKSVDRLKGAMVWLITGEGDPRKYSLCSCFPVRSVWRVDDEEFPNRASGDGVRFQPMVPLNDEPWFEELRKSQANFSLGLNTIRDEFIVPLTRLVEAAGYELPSLDAAPSEK